MTTRAQRQSSGRNCEIGGKGALQSSVDVKQEVRGVVYRSQRPRHANITNLLTKPNSIEGGKLYSESQNTLR